MVRLKVIFIFLLNLGLIFKLTAQNFKAQLLGGVNVSQVDGDSYSGYNQPGGIIGFSIFKNADIKYNYGFEMLFSQKGSHKKTTIDDPQQFQLRYTYICLPIFIDFKKLGEKMKKVNIRLALSNNLNITSKVNYGYGWTETNIKPWELSGFVGVNYKFTQKLGLMLRMENSLLSIGKPAPNNFYKTNRRGLYNRLFSFMLTCDLK